MSGQPNCGTFCNMMLHLVKTADIFYDFMDIIIRHPLIKTQTTLTSYVLVMASL